MPIEINDSNFEEMVLNSEKPVVVDFWAEWCGPCRTIGAFVEEMAQDFRGKAIVGKVNVDNCPEVTNRFGIRNIPTVLFFKGGNAADKQVGAVPKSVLVKKLEALL